MSCRTRGARFTSARPTGCRATSTGAIEYMLPIDNPTVHAQLLDQVMVANLIDNEQSWRLNADGTLHAAAAEGRAGVQPAQLFHDQPQLVGPGQALKKGRRVPKLRFHRGR